MYVSFRIAVIFQVAWVPIPVGVPLKIFARAPTFLDHALNTVYKDRKKTVAKRQGDQIENIVNSSCRGNRNCSMHLYASSSYEREVPEGFVRSLRLR